MLKGMVNSLEKMGPGISQQLKDAYSKKVTEYELAEHRKSGHKRFMPECAECRLGAIRRRSHRRQLDVAKPGGEVSMDLSGPHLPGRWPSASPEKYAKRAQYFLVASYRVFTQEEFDTATVDAEFAKKKAWTVHCEDEAVWEPDGTSGGSSG